MRNLIFSVEYYDQQTFLNPIQGVGLVGGGGGEGQDPPIGSVKAVTEAVQFLETFISAKHPILQCIYVCSI